MSDQPAISRRRFVGATAAMTSASLLASSQHAAGAEAVDMDHTCRSQVDKKPVRVLRGERNLPTVVGEST